MSLACAAATGQYAHLGRDALDHGAYRLKIPLEGQLGPLTVSKLGPILQGLQQQVPCSVRSQARYERLAAVTCER